MSLHAIGRNGSRCRSVDQNDSVRYEILYYIKTRLANTLIVPSDTMGLCSSSPVGGMASEVHDSVRTA